MVYVFGSFMVWLLMRKRIAVYADLALKGSSSSSAGTSASTGETPGVNPSNATSPSSITSGISNVDPTGFNGVPHGL